jgi:hypothetical protein
LVSEFIARLRDRTMVTSANTNAPNWPFFSQAATPAVPPPTGLGGHPKRSAAIVAFGRREIHCRTDPGVAPAFIAAMPGREHRIAATGFPAKPVLTCGRRRQ